MNVQKRKAIPFYQKKKEGGVPEKINVQHLRNSHSENDFKKTFLAEGEKNRPAEKERLEIIFPTGDLTERNETSKKPFRSKEAKPEGWLGGKEKKKGCKRKPPAFY